MSLEQLLSEAKKLPRLTHAQVLLNRSVQSSLIACVDTQLASQDNISTLIGNNPLQIMFDNHKHHATFMDTVFALGDYSLLVKTLPWVYRSYHAQHFCYDYFPVELNAWAEAATKYLPPELAEKIGEIYHWMISVHQQIITLSQLEPLEPPPISGNWLEEKNRFLANLLLGDHQSCREQAKQYVGTVHDLEEFYLYILHPAMFDIGTLWESAQISIAQEHLASTIVNRIMAQVVGDLDYPVISKGTVIVSASPNEFHELGAWMLADILEFDGWQVNFIGANVPEEKLTGYVKSIQPDILALSVTIPFNLEKARSVIQQLKEDAEAVTVKVMVGGRAFIDNPSIWKTIGADGYAVNIAEARQLAQNWYADHG